MQSRKCAYPKGEQCKIFQLHRVTMKLILKKYKMKGNMKLKIIFSAF